MSILSLRNVVKQYHNHRAVDGVSFDIPKGSIFGLLGPNGAGKTSLIRIITTITGADEGEVLLDGEKINADSPKYIGYMPEERGLYKKMMVGEQLMYLAQLRGMSKSEAKTAIRYWLEKFDNKDWWDKKIEELSKGMQQKIQFIATVMHKPKLLILDEPFTGLDPLNTNLIKEEIHRMNQEGVSVVFSTHRMEQVEEICKDIVLINQGKKVLEGKVDEIKETYKDNLYRIEFDGSFPHDLNSSSFTVRSDSDKDVIIQVSPNHDSNQLLQALIQKGIRIKSFTEVLPTLNEIFIKQVEN
jgi:ABC-2 type transport system ATP-binding protein